MALLLNTTTTVTINDLIDTNNAGAVFTHPVVDYNLLEKWDVEDIRNSADMQAAIDAGNISVSFQGSPLKSLTNLGLSSTPSSIITQFGRFQAYTNNRWVTSADDNYGVNTQTWNEQAGTGADPLVEWEHVGELLPHPVPPWRSNN